jgi:hypothetical protein
MIPEMGENVKAVYFFEKEGGSVSWLCEHPISVSLSFAFFTPEPISRGVIQAGVTVSLTDLRVTQLLWHATTNQ